MRIGCFYSNPQRLIVTWKGKYKRDMNPSGYDFGNVVRPTPSDPCGSNTYVGWENKLYFTLCGTTAGDKGVQIRTLPVIRLAITSTQLVDVGLDEFFDAPGQMTTNIGELRLLQTALHRLLCVHRLSTITLAASHLVVCTFSGLVWHSQVPSADRQRGARLCRDRLRLSRPSTSRQPVCK